MYGLRILYDLKFESDFGCLVVVGEVCGDDVNQFLGELYGEFRYQVGFTLTLLEISDCHLIWEKFI